jgi:hypothetical protein
MGLNPVLDGMGPSCHVFLGAPDEVNMAESATVIVG